MAQAYKCGINKVKNKNFPTSLQTLEILILTEDVEILDPRFGHLHKEIKKQKLLLKVNSKMILIVLSFVVLLVVLMIYLSQMFGEELLLIAISDSDSLYDNANTQGRNVMWEEIYENFTKSGFFSRLFGVDLISDTSMGFDSHNAYVKILYSSGYCGLALFAIISLRLAKVLNRMKNMGQRNLFYLTIGFLTIFYIAGFSASTIVFTQISWFAFFFAGACVSNVSQSKRLQLLNK